MKKVCCIFTLFFIVFTLVACNSIKNDKNNNSSTQQEEITENEGQHQETDNDKENTGNDNENTDGVGDDSKDKNKKVVQPISDGGCYNGNNF